MKTVEIFLKGLTAKQLISLISFLAGIENTLESLEPGKLFIKGEYAKTSIIMIADIVKIEGNVQTGFDVMIEVLESVLYQTEKNQFVQTPKEEKTPITYLTQLFQSVDLFCCYEQEVK